MATVATTDSATLRAARKPRMASSLKRRKVGESRAAPGSSSCVISYDSLKGAVSKPRLPPAHRDGGVDGGAER